MLKKYIRNVFVALDQLVNTLRGGDPDETISSVAAKKAHSKGWGVLGRFLEAIDSGHLRRSREDDEGKDSLWKDER